MHFTDHTFDTHNSSNSLAILEFFAYLSLYVVFKIIRWILKSVYLFKIVEICIKRQLYKIMILIIKLIYNTKENKILSYNFEKLIKFILKRLFLLKHVR